MGVCADLPAHTFQVALVGMRDSFPNTDGVWGSAPLVIVMAEKEKKSAPSSIGQFWKGVKIEFQRISWPDREKMVKHTAMVGIVSLILGIIIAIIDFLLQYGVDLITSWQI
jgi:preprotein translocase subunit SecE